MILYASSGVAFCIEDCAAHAEKAAAKKAATMTKNISTFVRIVIRPQTKALIFFLFIVKNSQHGNATFVFPSARNFPQQFDTGGFDMAMKGKKAAKKAVKKTAKKAVKKVAKKAKKK